MGDTEGSLVRALPVGRRPSRAFVQGIDEEGTGSDRKSLTTSVCEALCDVDHTSNQCLRRGCDPHPDV